MPGAGSASLRRNTSWSSQFRNGKRTTCRKTRSVNDAASAAAATGITTGLFMQPFERRLTQLGEARAGGRKAHVGGAGELHDGVGAPAEALERKSAVVNVLGVVRVSR